MACAGGIGRGWGASGRHVFHHGQDSRLKKGMNTMLRACQRTVVRSVRTLPMAKSPNSRPARLLTTHCFPSCNVKTFPGASSASLPLITTHWLVDVRSCICTTPGAVLHTACGHCASRALRGNQFRPGDLLRSRLWASFYAPWASRDHYPTSLGGRTTL